MDEVISVRDRVFENMGILLSEEAEKVEDPDVYIAGLMAGLTLSIRYILAHVDPQLRTEFIKAISGVSSKNLH